MTRKNVQNETNRGKERLGHSEVTLFWFRRDLRLYDNAGLYHALKENNNVLPIFIFDQDILKFLNPKDLRVQFIHQTVSELKKQLQQLGTDLLVYHGKPHQVWQQLIDQYPISCVYTNHDYEPKARSRDEKVAQILSQKKIKFKTYKDQTLFEKDEIKTDAGNPYTVYTPYKKKCLAYLNDFYLKSYPNDLYQMNYLKNPHLMFKEINHIPTLESMGFQTSAFVFPETSVSRKMLSNYAQDRDYPYLDKATSRLGLHLRFGTVSVRELAREGQKYSDVWLSELIWRDFFMQILWHYPHVENSSFRPQYEKIKWRNSEEDFNRWKNGETGFPIVDAGMRELNATGHMHNRVRMIVASFLSKHLLQHWLRGERYFADKLLDYDLSANNGNWQWAAGTGCDAAPYFRVFNPDAQTEKFDPQFKYIKKWVPEFGTRQQIKPMIDHKFARDRALTEYKKGLA